MRLKLEQRVTRLATHATLSSWHDAYAARERLRAGVMRVLTGEARDPAKRTDPAQSRRDGELLRRFTNAGGVFPNGGASPLGDQILASIRTLKSTWSPEEWERFASALRKPSAG